MLTMCLLNLRKIGKDEMYVYVFIMYYGIIQKMSVLCLNQKFIACVIVVLFYIHYYLWCYFDKCFINIFIQSAIESVYCPQIKDMEYIMTCFLVFNSGKILG